MVAKNRLAAFSTCNVVSEKACEFTRLRVVRVLDENGEMTRHLT